MAVENVTVHMTPNPEDSVIEVEWETNKPARGYMFIQPDGTPLFPYSDYEDVIGYGMALAEILSEPNKHGHEGPEDIPKKHFMDSIVYVFNNYREILANRDNLMKSLFYNNCACCLEAFEPRGINDPWEGRLDAYCRDCAESRCDAYPGDCRKRRLEPKDYVLREGMDEYGSLQ